MPLILPGNVGSATAATGFNIDNSVRFNGANHDLRIAPGSVSNRRTMTISFWTKRSILGGNGSGLIAGWGDGYEGGFASMIYFNDADQLEIDHDIAGVDYNFHSDMVFIDVSAWYNIVIAIDTTQGTEANRQKIYVNGTQITLTETALGFPPQNFDTFFNNTLTVVGSSGYEGGSGAVPEYSGYFSEFVMIDGSALAADQFGEFDSDSGIWKPIDVSGLTFGTNGFHLEFKESGTSQNASGLGADTSGNTNHLAVTALTATDQSLDTCTNNFATMNPLNQTVSGGVFSEGNLIFTRGGNALSSVSTFAITTGKWYWEWKQLGGNTKVGIGSINTFTTKASSNAGTSVVTNAGGAHTGGLNTYTYSKNGKSFSQTKDGNNSGVTYGNTWTTNDIIGCAFDATNGTIWFSKNGTWQDSATISEIQNGTTTNAAYSSIASDTFYVIQDGEEAAGVGHSIAVNFGSPPYSESGGNSDGNGHGNFAATVPSGFYSLNTKNIAEFT